MDGHSLSTSVYLFLQFIKQSLRPLSRLLCRSSMLLRVHDAACVTVLCRGNYVVLRTFTGCAAFRILLTSIIDPSSALVSRGQTSGPARDYLCVARGQMTRPSFPARYCKRSSLGLFESGNETTRRVGRTRYLQLLVVLYPSSP